MHLKNDIFDAIGVDADSIHSRIKEILLRAAKKYDIDIFFVADRELKDIQRERDKNQVKAHSILVKEGSDSADNWIVDNSSKFCLVVTHDIPLAKRLVEKDVIVIDERGKIITKENIGELSSTRDFMTELRNIGIFENKKGAKHPLKEDDIRLFANSLNSTLEKHFRN